MATPQKLVDTGIEAAKSAPPVAVISATVVGMKPEQWVLILTVIYLVLQIGWLLWKWWKALSTKGWTPRDN